MRWTKVLAILATIGSAAAIIVYKYRRVDVEALGALSDGWIAEHAPDRPE